MEKSLIDLLKNSELFWGVSDEGFERLCSAENVTEETFECGEVVFSAERYVPALGVVVSGSCNVFNRISNAMIGFLSEGEVFGFQSLLLDGDSFPGVISAKTRTKIAFISKDAVLSLIGEEPSFSMSYIRYLSKRIVFLNKRIESFTGKNAETRLALFLRDKFGEYKTFSFEKPLSSLAVSLDIGRASLYRAFGTLEEAGAISKDGKTIRLLNREVLESFTF